jgi:sulfur carrier protein ThiS
VTVRVRFFGTLGERFPGCRFPNGRRAQGFPVEVPAGAAVHDLLAALGLEREPGIVALVDGRTAGGGDPLPEEVQVMLLKAMGGG